MNSLLQTLYAHSPVIVQNVGVTLYGLKVYRREYGRKFRRALEAFEKQQWYTPEELRVYQDERLRLLIEFCYQHVPYYRRVMDARKLRPIDLRSVDDLNKLPTLTREDIRRNREELIASNVRPFSLNYGNTSGTTASPLQLVWDDNVCLVKNVVDWRLKRWAGVSPGDRMAFLSGRVSVPVKQRRPPFWRHNWVLNHLFFSCFHISRDNLQAYLDKLASFQPKALEGYPTAMYILARFLLSRNQTFPVAAVFCSSEPLAVHQREVIEKAFACKVFDFYGMGERVVFAGECPFHEGKHLNSDFGITEILAKDGHPAAPGDLGRVIATGLHNFAMPLIRYVTSDVTGIQTRSCSCKRHFPLMQDVTTKDLDIITTKDGRYISPTALDHPFKPLDSVEESQIIQEDRDHIRIKIVKKPNYQDAHSQSLLEDFRKRVGPGIEVEIEFVESIPRTEAGKFRWVISKVPLEF